MDYRTEQALEELVIAMDEDGLDGINKWREARKSKVAERQRQAQQFAVENPVRFGLMRMELGKAVYAGKLVPAIKPVEWTWITHETMPMFSKSIGVRLDELTDMLDGKRLEVKGNGGQVWRSDSSPRWSASRTWVDTSKRDTFREEMLAEDKAQAIQVGKHNDWLKQVTTSAAEPTYKEFKA